MSGAKVQPVFAYRLRSPDMQILDRLDVVGSVDFKCCNDFRCRSHYDTVVDAVGLASCEKIAEFGPDPLSMAVRDRREQHELAGGDFETLLADPAFTQQHRLAAVKQRMHHRAPFLECSGFHHCIASRRSGGEVFGGWRRGGSASNSRAVVAATSATATSKASTLADDGWVMPLTLRTYCRAAAAISSVVAGGSRPRKSVVF